MANSADDAGNGSVPEAVPQGFERLPEGLAFIDALQPVYRKVDGANASFGLVVQARHGNTMGICHGGVLMTLADMAAATGVNLARGELSGSPTISMNMDFVAAAQRGEWIQADAQEVSLKRRFGFCRGTISCGRGVVARFSGTFYFPDHKGLWKAGATPQSLFDAS